MFSDYFTPQSKNKEALELFLLELFCKFGKSLGSVDTEKPHVNKHANIHLRE